MGSPALWQSGDDGGSAGDRGKTVGELGAVVDFSATSDHTARNINPQPGASWAPNRGGGPYGRDFPYFSRWFCA